MLPSRPRYSIIAPVFNEEEVLPEFYRRTRAVMDALEGETELILVFDGSRDRSPDIGEDLRAQDPRVKLVKFSRNFGHQIAITAGLDRARGDCVVVIDADLQDPPEVIARMVEKWREGFDVVYGVRTRRRGDGVMKRVTASAFYRLLDRITGIDIPRNAGDFRLMSRRAQGELNQLREKDRFVRGLVAWIGFRQAGVAYERDERYAGETKYPLRKMVMFALDGITSFSSAPLKLATWLGYATSLLAFLYLASVFVQRFLGMTVPGWATIMVALLFLGGVQLICLGIIGEYLGRVFNEIKPRPIYVVDTVIGGEGAGAERAGE
jgi:dolichol-phosphate mannosyltransferase